MWLYDLSHYMLHLLHRLMLCMGLDISVECMLDVLGILDLKCIQVWGLK
jgi:hypothetical protein